MARILLALLSTLVIINTIHARFDSLNDLLRRALQGGVSFYLNNIDAISTDLMKDQDPKEDCVFYVNSYGSTREKAAAIAFAAMRNRQLTANGGRPTANTLYDAYDDLAFGMEGALMRQAHAGGAEYLRRYFKVTSGAYARQCRGTVWVIVKKGTEIYHDSIWLTDEYPALILPNSGVTAIWEIDPAEIEAAQRDPNHELHPIPYRGGLPPGARPPRSIEAIRYNKKDASSIKAKIKKYGRYPDVANGYLPPKSLPSPKCDMSDSSRVPYNVFDGVFGIFCRNTLNDPLSRLDQIVDSHGFVTRPKKRSLLKRTPPPNPDAYIDYKFGLSWSGGKGTCSLSCDEAFNLASNSPWRNTLSQIDTFKFSLSGGHTAGTQNIMATSGTVDAGCGQYKWTIIKPRQQLVSA
ncbi:hypothetical protein PSHT_07345 [Puccinia striiformis]|uniref:Uncharacterized protein n=1 Tax=Puccinia striiformis TaxID=27350 RepID=A0A2S4VYH9_9BASI|nr:hypothetical protein PSHT_07345 [Puccinia striiformis]